MRASERMLNAQARAAAAELVGGQVRITDTRGTLLIAFPVASASAGENGRVEVRDLIAMGLQTGKPSRLQAVSEDGEMLLEGTVGRGDRFDIDYPYDYVLANAEHEIPWLRFAARLGAD